jgi:hypothetical protein
MPKLSRNIHRGKLYLLSYKQPILKFLLSHFSAWIKDRVQWLALVLVVWTFEFCSEMLGYKKRSYNLDVLKHIVTCLGDWDAVQIVNWFS